MSPNCLCSFVLFSSSVHDLHLRFLALQEGTRVQTELNELSERLAASIREHETASTTSASSSSAAVPAAAAAVAAVAAAARGPINEEGALEMMQRMIQEQPRMMAFELRMNFCLAFFFIMF